MSHSSLTPDQQAQDVLRQLRVLVEEGHRLPSSSSALPLVPSLKLAQRLAASHIVASKKETEVMRVELDRRGLELSGLEYEKRRLNSEIQRCEAFDSIYQNVPLPPADPSLGQADLHQHFLTSLETSLSDLQSLQAEAMRLRKSREVLQKEIKDSKNKLAGTEDALKDFSKMAAAVQSKMTSAVPQSTTA